ncbi:glycine zipper 2TM domain-containing protein [uncultured Piscinibacter sp.]|uniref:glycine zipper 2TM domain-containing protein n=1 Tax=uncultured Piscinibacter sp. TaxID=1131835 RepID=UPI002634487E|nr:glycine zipper 2TM domain-containing protein [uncultured Piscinibacter sp.]
MPERPSALLLPLALLALLGACASPPARNEAIGQAYDSRSREDVQYGTVIAIEAANGPTHTTGGGAVLGAVIGAVVGNQVGSGTGRAAATGVGAVGGALIGNTLEKRRQDDDDFYRIRVRFNHGGVGEFNYRTIGDLRVGDRVRAEAGQLERR